MRMDSSPDDSPIIARAAAGDRSAFDLLVARYAGSMLSEARGRLRHDPDAAHDAVQNALVAAWRGLPLLRDPTRLRAWLGVLVRHECGRVRPIPGPLDSELRAPEPPEGLDLHVLTESEREAVLLCLADGWSVAEAATFLGVPRTTVESRLRNARLRLREAPMTPSEPLPPFSDLALPYDEFRWPVPPVVPEPFGEFRRGWLLSHLPGASVERVESVDVERTDVHLRLDGARTIARLTYSVRRGGSEDEAALLPILRAAGLPVPRLLAPPVIDPAAPERGALLAVEAPVGVGLDEWASSPNRTARELDKATEILLGVRDLVAGATDAVSRAAPRLERATLREEAARTRNLGGPWLADPGFVDALARLEETVPTVPLVLSNGGPPPWTVRVDANGDFLQIAGFAWARFEDPHYGITKMWTYEAVPWRQTGIVERYALRHGLTRRDLGPRLAVRALVTLQREVPYAEREGDYGRALLGWLRRGLEWAGIGPR